MQSDANLQDTQQEIEAFGRDGCRSFDEETDRFQEQLESRTVMRTSTVFRNDAVGLSGICLTVTRLGSQLTHLESQSNGVKERSIDNPGCAHITSLELNAPGRFLKFNSTQRHIQPA